jgi:hypothetical protein
LYLSVESVLGRVLVAVSGGGRVRSAWWYLSSSLEDCCRTDLSAVTTSWKLLTDLESGASPHERRRDGGREGLTGECAEGLQFVESRGELSNRGVRLRDGGRGGRGGVLRWRELFLLELQL